MRYFPFTIKRNFQVVFFSFFIFFLMIPAISAYGQGIIIDHTCTDVSKIPDYWINQLKTIIKLHYGHTSHGSQLIEGIKRLANPSLPVYDPRLTYTLQYNTLPTTSHLCILDGQLTETYITPSLYWRNGGDTHTRQTLNAYPALNVSMWSWCNEVSWVEEWFIDEYLEAMNDLESDYPNVKFIYMTGNAQETGEPGYNRYMLNEKIRKFCRDNNKILFDFADLDCWYNGEQATYDYNGQKIPVEHPEYHGQEWHTTFSSCENKGRAFWWLLAVLAGWTSFNCDVNWDGHVNGLDLTVQREEVLTAYNNWLHNCWFLQKECADFNNDGTIDSDDIVDKITALSTKISYWIENCSQNKKRSIKR